MITFGVEKLCKSTLILEAKKVLSKWQNPCEVLEDKADIFYKAEYSTQGKKVIFIKKRSI